jgi:hypothetical protein
MGILKSADFERASQLIQIIEKSIQHEDEALTAIMLYFADEDDPEFVFRLQMPTTHTKHIKLFSKAELIRRRLNACSKGLLELQRERDRDRKLVNAKVEYMHRTVRDFVRRREIWTKLRAATPSFDPAVRLSTSALACFKIGYMRFGTGIRESSS